MRERSFPSVHTGAPVRFGRCTAGPKNPRFDADRLVTYAETGGPLFQLDGNGVVLVLAARGRLHLTDVLELRIRPQQLTGEDGRTGAERSGAGHAEERVRHRPPQRGRVPLSACV